MNNTELKNAVKTMLKLSVLWVALQIVSGCSNTITEPTETDYSQEPTLIKCSKLMTSNTDLKLITEYLSPTTQATILDDLDSFIYDSVKVGSIIFNSPDSTLLLNGCEIVNVKGLIISYIEL